jgi:hypothetical protein
VWRCGLRSVRIASRHDPGPIIGSPPSRKLAPASRSASSCARPSAPARPSKRSPPEWATMNHGGSPEASRPPIIAPAEVPTMRSALPGSQPVSDARASSAPVSHAPPMTPPAPRTSPTLTGDRLAVAWRKRYCRPG